MPVYTSNGRLVKSGTYGGETRVAAMAATLGVNILMMTSGVQTLWDVQKKRQNCVVLVDVDKYRELNEVPLDANLSVVALANFIKEGRFCVVIRFESRHFEHCGTIGTPVHACSFEPLGDASHVCDLGSSVCVCSQKRQRRDWTLCLRERRSSWERHLLDRPLPRA